MGHLCVEQQVIVDGSLPVGGDADGDDLVGMGGEILTLIGHALLREAVMAEGAVDVEFAVIAAGSSLVGIGEVESSQGLVVLRIVALHLQLQLVGFAVVFGKQCLAYLGNPLVGILVHRPVDGFAGPQGNVVQINHIVDGTAIHERTHLAVADGQRLSPGGGGLVIPKK